MNASQKAYELIKQSEGCRLDAYEDGGGIPTIGWGETEGVKLGDMVTQAQADAMMQAKVARIEKTISETVTVRITQNMFDALVDFVYNIGESAFKKSHLVSYLNIGEIGLASQEFLRWDHQGNQVVPALMKRRRDELKLFLTV